MTAEIDDNEPVPKLTTKLRSEIMPPEPFEYTVLKPAEPTVEPENKKESNSEMELTKTFIDPEEEERFEETMRNVETPKVQEHKPQRQKTASKSKGIRKSLTQSRNTDASISKLHNELQKHSDARMKAEREILDIRKELKDLLLVHHATIKDLKKQVAQMHRKIVTIESSKKSAKVKTTAKKTTRNKKTSSSMKSKKKSGQKKSRKRQ
jgi:hypothetical protein